MRILKYRLYTNMNKTLMDPYRGVEKSWERTNKKQTKTLMLSITRSPPHPPPHDPHPLSIRSVATNIPTPSHRTPSLSSPTPDTEYMSP